jgi:hypothetical protein
MIMADVLKIFLIIVGLLLVFNAYWLLGAGLFPNWTERCSARFGQPLRTMTLGLVIGLPLFFIGILVVGKLGNPVFKIIGGIFVAVPVVLGLMGSAGLSRRIGEGLVSAVDEAQPWRRVLRGGIVLSLTFVLPLVGWFVVLPLSIIGGLGAAILSFKKPEAGTPDAKVETGESSP